MDLLRAVPGVPVWRDGRPVGQAHLVRSDPPILFATVKPRAAHGPMRAATSLWLVLVLLGLWAGSLGRADGAPDRAWDLAVGQLSEDTSGAGRADRALERAGTAGFRIAQTCCPGCQYDNPNRCCCAPGHQAVRERRVTVVRYHRGVQRTLAPKAIARAAGSVDRSSPADDDRPHALYARNLCPVCPEGSAASYLSLWERFGLARADVTFCCPKVVVTITRTQTVRVPAPRATHAGFLFTDTNKDGKFTAGVDTPIANRWILVRRPDGTILARVKTDADGRYSFKTAKAPGGRFRLSFPQAPNKILQTIRTDAAGNSNAIVAIPGGVISGTAFWDKNGNGARDPGELSLARTVLVIKFANGTVWKKITTDGKGRWKFPYGGNYPGMQLTVSTLNGLVIKKVKLDTDGNGVRNIPVPMVSLSDPTAAAIIFAIQPFLPLILSRNSPKLLGTSFTTRMATDVAIQTRKRGFQANT